MSLINEIKFIVDNNVGKLAKWLRIMGYDSVFFADIDDSRMVARALAEDRVILTRDTEIMKRRVVTIGRLKAILLTSEESEEQLRKVIETLNLDCQFSPFTICLECNQPLVEKSKDEVKDRVPAHVFQTQNQYMECPTCQRIYWRGTHWEAMSRKLERLKKKPAQKTK